jgi:predicted amidohydrolase
VLRDADGKGRHQALVVGPDGTELVRYTKLHPFCLGSEHQHFRRGEALALFPWQGFTVAPLICYDLRFPEAFRCAVARGATLFVIIANWPQAREDHWLTLARARAIENLAYVVTVNRVGRDPHLAYSGRSQVINPRGEIVADAGNAAGWLAAALDAELVRNCRRGFPALNDIRPEFLGAACRG